MCSASLSQMLGLVEIRFYIIHRYIYTCMKRCVRFLKAIHLSNISGFKHTITYTSHKDVTIPYCIGSDVFIFPFCNFTIEKMEMSR